MFEAFFGFKKGPFSQNPDPQQLFESAGWSQVRARLQFLVDHRGVVWLPARSARENLPQPARCSEL